MNSKMDSKKRFLELDILKGIGILLMVFNVIVAIGRQVFFWK